MNYREIIKETLLGLLALALFAPALLIIYGMLATL